MARSDVHEIFGGQATIFKITGASGDVYQFRQWITGEKQAFRKSLRTRDIAVAKRLAEELVVENLANQQKGIKLFGITLQEGIDRYLNFRLGDVESGEITKGRHSTMKSQLSNLIKIFGRGDLKISEMDRHSLNVEDRMYFRDRRKMSNTVTEISIANEQSTINAMMMYLFKNGMSHFERFEFKKIRINRNAIRRRDNFSLTEYRRLTRFLVEYTKDKSSDLEALYERRLIREYILILANTMLRVGELNQLKWRDIRGFIKTQDTNGTDMHMCHLYIRGETSKVRNDRDIIVRGGDYFQRLKKIQKYTEAEDYVFNDNRTRRKLNRNRIYSHWHAIMKGLEIDYKGRNISYYSLRHFSITQRLRANVSIYSLSELAGTSVNNISNFYGHITRDMQIEAARKSAKQDAEFSYHSEERLLKV